MFPKLVEIIFWKHMAYIPSKIFYKCGICSSTDPIYIVNPTVSEISPAVKIVLNKNLPIQPNPTVEEAKKINRFLIEKLKAKSWRQFYSEAVSYLIEISNHGILLMKPDIDSRKGWNYSEEGYVRYLHDTNLDIICQEILDDNRNRF